MTRVLLLLTAAALALSACGKRPDFDKLKRPSDIEAQTSAQ